MPHGVPGSILRQRRVACPAGVPARTWQVVHTTVGTTGAPAAVSGTVLVPRQRWDGTGARPLLTYGVGVHGLGRNSAPSHWLRRDTEPEVAQIELALDRGWAVALTDGEGLGMPGPHTYGAGGVGGRAMLDVVGLVLELPEQLGAHTRGQDPWADPEWRSVLRDERAGQRAPEVPTYLYHVVDDAIVPHRLLRELAADYRSRGGTVTYVDVVADDHLAGSRVGAEDAVRWLAHQLRDQPMVASASLKVADGRITAAAFSGSGRK